MLTVRPEFGVRLQTLSRTVATICRRLLLHLPNRSHHTCSLAWPALAAVWTSKLNIFPSAGFQWEPVGNCRSLQQQECAACSLVFLQFIVLTWTCNNNPSPSLFSPGLSISIQILHHRRAKSYRGRNGEAWGIFLPHQQNIVLWVQVGVRRHSKVDTAPRCCCWSF